MRLYDKGENSFAFLLRYLWRHRWPHAVLFLSIVAAVGASVGTRFSLKYLVDAIAAGPDQMPLVWQATAIFLVLVGADNLLWRVGGFAAARAFPTVGAELRLELFRHLLGHSAGFFSGHFSGALANRVTAAGNATFTIENTVAWNVLPPACAIVLSLATLLFVNVGMALALAAAVVVIAVFMVLGSLRGQPLHAAYADRAAAVGGEIVDIVSNHGTVRAFAAAHRECARLESHLDEEIAAHQRALRYMELLRITHAASIALLTGGMLVWAVLLWQEQQITAGDVIVVGSFSLALLQASRDLAVAFVDISHHWSRLGDAVASVTVPHDLADASEASPFVHHRGDVAFEHVSFAYPSGQVVIDDVSLHIPGGQRVALVGPSGAGKTTLLSLVQRLYPASDGRILIDGQDVATLSQETLRQAIAVVPQDVVLFHRSILDNIRYGRPDATDEEVREAARAAQCDSFVRGLADGYATKVGERGARLSGGQRQRVGIARAILANAPIVILDEATSALDSESEARVQRALANLLENRTVLAIAHRLSTIAAFDRAIVMDHGRIVEDGAPAELQRRNGLFAAFWRMQTADGAGPGQDSARPSEMVPAETRRPSSVREARQHGYA
jgi:ATP-binding cassette subfamily B protein